MCYFIRHRGPDDEGVWVDEGVALGMRRLSIIDLSTGHQPIHNEDRSVWIVFNGEIYNFRELRRELEAAGHRFYTSTDTEVIVHAYEEWGKEAIAGWRDCLLASGNADGALVAREASNQAEHYATVREPYVGRMKSLLQAPDHRAIAIPRARSISRFSHAE